MSFKTKSNKHYARSISSFHHYKNSPPSSTNASIVHSYSSLVTKLPNPPSYLHHKQLQFVIMDAPTDDNLSLYILELARKSVQLIVRTCEPTYNSEGLLKQHQISVLDMAYPDGHPPTAEIIDEWLQIVAEENLKNARPIAVHCVAGLGRAPVLVAIALIDICNMLPSEAIQLIREKRRGAINQKQYEYLKNYQKRKKHECLSCAVL